jgi:hypothetical protein
MVSVLFCAFEGDHKCRRPPDGGILTIPLTLPHQEVFNPLMREKLVKISTNDLMSPILTYPCLVYYAYKCCFLLFGGLSRAGSFDDSIGYRARK